MEHDKKATDELLGAAMPHLAFELGAILERLAGKKVVFCLVVSQQSDGDCESECHLVTNVNSESAKSFVQQMQTMLGDDMPDPSSSSNLH